MRILSGLKQFGKYLDQPALVKKLYNTVPIVLAGTAGFLCARDTFKASKEEKKNKFIKSFSVLSLTILSALVATRGLKIKGKQLFEGLIELPHKHLHDVEDVLSKVNKSKNPELFELVQKVKNDEILKLAEVKKLDIGLNKIDAKADLMSKVIPKSHNHGPFAELSKLSLLGLIPVVGGVTGGIIGDKLTGEDWKKKLPNKVKEGAYQYLNNIFLCNVGAGIAMLLMNKLNVKSKAVRFIAMMTGVVSVGLVAGSAIANYVSNNFINPIFDKEKPKVQKLKDITLKELNKERHPEAVDLCLHVDDIASVGFLNGFKWIGPALPFLYSVSGYRAGIGYRNGKHSH